MWQRWNSATKLLEKSSDEGVSWTPLGLDAAVITQGIFADARLSAYFVNAKAGQVAFPATQNASSNVNTLDDYEEGTWTPSLGGSTSQSGQVYTSQTGFYTKIGRHVWVQGDLAWSTLGTITGNVQIKGLPFTSSSSPNGRGICKFGYFVGFTTSVSWVGGYISQNGTAITLTLTPAVGAGGISFLAQANMSAAQDLLFAADYDVD